MLKPPVGKEKQPETRCSQKRAHLRQEDYCDLLRLPLPPKEAVAPPWASDDACLALVATATGSLALASYWAVGCAISHDTQNLRVGFESITFLYPP